MSAANFTYSITTNDGTYPLSTNPRKVAIDTEHLFRKLAGGHFTSPVTVKYRTGAVFATGTVTAAVVQNADTVTINGQALTAQQANSRGTVTITAASVDVDDTVVVNGTTFTAKNAEDTDAGEFDISGTDAAAATSLAACINASSDLSGIVTANAAAAVCTIRAVTAGTDGDAITLTSSDAQLAVSGATLSGGAAVANNKFDFGGSDTETAAALAAAINASTTAIVNKHVTATSSGAVVTLTAATPGHAGNSITLASSDAGRLLTTGARLTGGTETLTTLTY